MNIAYIVVALLLGLLMLFSSYGKFTRNPGVIEGLKKVGVPERYFTLLGIILVLGALGLIAGIWLRPLGLAAAIGSSVYFIGAVISHLRVKDTPGSANLLIFLIPSLAAVILAAVTL